jgi:hypothetical protein
MVSRSGTIFANRHLPRRPAWWATATNSAFLAAFRPAAGLPYLADVSRLDRCGPSTYRRENRWRRRGCGANEQLADAVLRPHASARWAWLPTSDIFLWQRNRAVRTASHCRRQVANKARCCCDPTRMSAIELSARCAFSMHAPRSTLQAAGLAAVETEPGVDLSALIAQLLRAGAFASICSPLKDR